MASYAYKKNRLGSFLGFHWQGVVLTNSNCLNLPANSTDQPCLGKLTTINKKSTFDILQNKTFWTGSMIFCA